MQNVFLSVISLSFNTIPLLLLLFMLQKWLKQHFDASWVRLIWIAVLIRLLLPYSVTGYSLIKPNLFTTALYSETGGGGASSFLRNIPVFQWLALLWALVAGLLFLYHVIDYGVFRRHLLRWSHEPHDPTIYEIMEQVRRAWKLPRSLKILICSEMKTPAAVGFLFPVILLPSEHFDDADLELILHHEAAHMHRGDIAVKWCAMFMRCLYWFHPLVYMLHSRLEDDLEVACDAAVMRKFGQEQEIQKYYSYLILDIAAGKSGRFYPFTTCLEDTKECLRTRIDNIFDTKQKKSGLPVLVLCSLGLLLSTGFLQLQYSDTSGSGILPNTGMEQQNNEDSLDQSVVTIDLYQLEQQLEEQGT